MDHTTLNHPMETTPTIIENQNQSLLKLVLSPTLTICVESATTTASTSQKSNDPTIKFKRTKLTNTHDEGFGLLHQSSFSLTFDDYIKLKECINTVDNFLTFLFHNSTNVTRYGKI